MVLEVVEEEVVVVGVWEILVVAAVVVQVEVVVVVVVVGVLSRSRSRSRSRREAVIIKQSSHGNSSFSRVLDGQCVGRARESRARTSEGVFVASSSSSSSSCL